MPTAVKEITADRTASTSTWRNSDGSLSVRRYLTPHFYKTASGAWSSIDPSLSPVAGKPGWWRSGANSWSVAFGPAGTQGGALRFTVGGHTFGLAPQGVKDGNQPPSVAGDSATYHGIWPQADLVENVSASAVKEDLVVNGSGGPSSFSFVLSGAKAVPNQAGGLDVVVGGARVGTLPAPTVSVYSAKSSRDQTTASKVRMTVAGDVVRVSVSPDWLAGLPASAFPVVIDPSFFAPSPSSSWQMYSVSDDGQVLNGVMQIGQDGAGSNWRPEVYVPAPAPPSTSPGEQPWQFAGVELYLPSDSQLTDALTYGLSGYSSFSDIPRGALFPGWVAAGQSATYAGGISGLGGDSGSYITSRSDGWWFGLGTPSQVSGPNGGSLGTFDPSSSMFVAVYDQQPNPTTITSPANTSVLSTTTPTLTADHLPVDSYGTDSNYYDFRVSTSPDGTGTVIDSGWLTQADFYHPVPMTWTVPPGSLHDGATYYVKVLTSEWVLYSSDPQFTGSIKPSSSSTISFVVKQRLGDGGPSPTDTVGSPPAGTVTPSKGAPSPGVPTASETVNLLNGNLAATVGTSSMQTVSGSAGLALSYNSAQSSVSKGGNYGLTGQYYADGGAHTFTSPLAGQRTDAAVNATWQGGQAPIGTLRATDSTLDSPFMVRWTGVLTLPAGTWQLGGSTTGGMRVYLNGSTTPTYDDWAGTAGSTSPSYGSATLGGSQTYQIEVDSWALGKFNTTDTVQLWAQDTDITDPTVPSQWVVPSGWLTPTATGVPPGWSLLANPSTAQWIHADDEGNQVVLQGVSGETALFTRQAPGFYQSQPGNNDHLNVDGNGRLQLATSDNQLYTFNPDGSLASMTSATDDRHPAALQYSYSGTPALLHSITDPVSGRTIGLFYGGDAACPTTNPAPAGMLCKVSYWNGTATTFGYNGNGQIASVTDPLGQTDLLAYDSDNRLADIRDALASNYVAAGGQAGTPVDCPTGTTGLSVTPVDTQVCYDSSGRVATVIQPAPTPGAARPARTYTYASGHTDMAIAGFAPASGYASRTSYDGQGRITQQNDSSGRTTTTVWANATAPGNNCTNLCGSDQPVVTATPDGEQTSKVYDANGNVTDVYGPAPLACFSGGWPNGVTPTAPVQGYLPVSNPQGTTGCGIPAVPHTHNRYDEGMTGLAASFWSNGQAAGPVTMHANGPGGTQPQSLCEATSGRLCAHWDAGAPPISSDASGQWSLRLTGIITLASGGAYDLGIASSQAITVSFDGAPKIHDGPDVSGFVPGQTRTTSAASGIQFAAGVHAIQVDFQGSATQLNEFAVSLTPAPGTGGVISNSILDPGYHLQTSTTDADGVVTTTSYSDANLGPQYGLATATTVGAGTSTALTTSTTYEPPGASTYLRKTGRTLPAGNTTTYAYYTGTDGPLAAVCGVAANTPQGGQVKSQTDPAPTFGAPAREQQFVYDAAGRKAGRRVGPSDSISSAPWQCTTYDAGGRITSQSWPAFNGAPARTATYTYSVGGNPLVSAVADSTGTITSTVDLLGRLVSYTDTTGQTSTVTYNQAGQLTATSGPQGALSNTYDPNSGSLATVTAGGTLLATTHYDTTTGRLTSVDYTNGTTANLGYDALGTQNSLVFTTAATGTLVAGDQTTLSPARRISSELEDINGTTLTNPNPAGPNATTYTYDGAGRLATAYLPGQSATYGYTSNPAGDNCASPGEGANTNRTNLTITPTGGSPTSTEYCYNNADQLVSSITNAGTNNQYGYDPHGNQTNDHGTTLTWDGADRLTSATPPSGGTTSYSYDALDRVVSHTAGGSTVRYAYAGYSDSPVATLDSSNNVLQRLVSLPGGVVATIQTSGNVWSYPDLHGNMTVTMNNTGTRLNGPVTYDPWGQPTAGSQTLNNAAGGNTLGAFGTNSKLTDTAAAITILGARSYQAAEARFLSVDPLEGGCANNYVYVFGDPFSKNDLTGRVSCTVTVNHYNLNRYWGSAYAASGAGVFGFIGKIGGSAWFEEGSRAARIGGGAGSLGLGAVGFNYGYAMATDGRWNWCQALIEGAVAAAFGALFG
jgi:RHS repeat-associated protein